MDEVREALLGHAEFMVLPSHSKNFGLVVAESLAAGRPVVTTKGTPWGRARSEIKMKIKIKEPSVAPSPLRGGAMEGGYAGGTELAQGDRRKEIAAAPARRGLGDGCAVEDSGNMNLEERKCGVICEVTDLKRGLERMLKFSDKEREEMGARGREWMR